MIINNGRVNLEERDYKEAANKSLILKLDIDANGKVISTTKKIISREV